ncbi:KIR protein [Plasmodium knowlesi strain H]|uniref:KIR protein n=3 Tax=Plasmodium knowlesi TaxID=5850 RepID=A0A5K1USA8_PLAKH|nr:KIR protein [Plasmodium knowlesi strain H]OTN67630.1 KIR protein [Plasmodium knowlesi]CAA9990339.1 KIR protein [Plasmodium knowlesi strain H]SBO19545.1 KIR protein [Plasmodium knowlesi strain H]SBO22744.1 KIR protein [Plasmodium knowlesi strain H]VVS79813.1 KIR protein [Plasmodium knowlesi strain H]|eukprot:XP_002260741.1 KIR protein [Plasmodium knowlesi strain H]
MSGSSEEGKKLQCNKTLGDLQSYKSQLGQRIEKISSNEKNAAEGVAPVWCCLSNIYNSSNDKFGPCHLIYYTVGSMIYKKLKDKNKFDEIMKEVYDILKPQLKTSECNIRGNSDSGKKLFELMEKFSYYNLDRRNVWKESEGDSQKVNCEGCADYLREVSSACKVVEAYCKEEQNNKKCGVIELDEGDESSPGYVAQLIDSFIPKTENGKITEEELQRLKEKQECLKELPSDMKHRTFSDIKNQCSDGNGRFAGVMKERLRTSLNESGCGANCANQIIRGACSARGTHESSSPNGDHCTSLYYYIGSVISTVPGSVTLFKDFMNSVYEKLGEFGISGECTNIHPKLDDKTTFDNMKSVYYYTRDYTTIRPYIQVPGAGGFSCTDIIRGYLDNVLSAYKYMEQECPQGDEYGSRNNKQWCKNFKSMTATRSLTELLQLKSSLEHISSLSTADSTTAVTTGSAVGGTLFTLGLPLAAFLSYKYDLLPSGIRKFFHNGRSGTRMRRSAFEPNSDAEMENFTEYYTENGSTTTDPTEYSTVAGSSSNLTTTSTEDSSILYDEDGPSRSPPLPRKKRGGGNNRRGQNISYHSMER